MTVVVLEPVHAAPRRSRVHALCIPHGLSRMRPESRWWSWRLVSAVVRREACSRSQTRTSCASAPATSKKPAPKGWLQCAAAPSSFIGDIRELARRFAATVGAAGIAEVGELEMLENVWR